MRPCVPASATHYVVQALDEAGNVSARSAEAVAVPQLAITSFEVRGVVDDAGVVAGTVERPSRRSTGPRPWKPR